MSRSPAGACRLCLVAPPAIDAATFPDRLAVALGGGDVAALILTGSDERLLKPLVRLAQDAEVAALVVDDTRLGGRTQADGIHIETGMGELKLALEKLRGRGIVGAGNLRSRHEAMTAGEVEPDYVFFGRLDGDTAPGIFPKALELAAWWSGLFEIPAMVMGGGALASVAEAAAAGIEFVALRSAVWDHPDGPGAAVAEANRLIRATARVPA
ncbi:MAG: thiamine phosphate synthase [Bauldia sp.]|nr:thiamine phosphate synthase [Bauldia sp.]